jgi:hypothetical protein
MNDGERWLALISRVEPYYILGLVCTGLIGNTLTCGMLLLAASSKNHK